MARPRRQKPPTSGSSSAYQRRNERARALGYRNYYDYRIHNHGRIPAGQAPPAPGSAERARLRGHRGTEDLIRSLRPGDVIVVPNGLPDVQKDRKGRYSSIEVMVLRNDGSTDRFTMRRKSYDQIAGVLERMAAKGAVFSPSPSLDLRRLVRVADRPDVDDEDDDE